MNEPRRLMEESENTLERTLLRAGTSYRASASTRAKTLLSLGLASSAALTASGATASVLAKSAWTKLFAISAIGAVTAFPILEEMLQEEAPVAASVAAVSPSPAPPARPQIAGSEKPAEQPLLESARPEEKVAEAPAVTARRPAVTRTTTRAPSPALAEELSALDGARAALASGDSRRALAQLEAYAKTHPRGRLQVEAEVLRIDALSRAGERQAAAKRAEAFLRRHPNSVLASRVRSYL